MVRKRSTAVGYRQSDAPVDKETVASSSHSAAAPTYYSTPIITQEMPEWILALPTRAPTPNGEEEEEETSTETYDLPPECSLIDNLWLRFWLLVISGLIVYSLWIIPMTRPCIQHLGDWSIWAFDRFEDKRTEYKVSGWAAIATGLGIWLGLEAFFWYNWLKAHKRVAEQRYVNRYEPPKLPDTPYSKRDNRFFRHALEADPSIIGVILGTVICLVIVLSIFIDLRGSVSAAAKTVYSKGKGAVSKVSPHKMLHKRDLAWGTGIAGFGGWFACGRRKLRDTGAACKAMAVKTAKAFKWYFVRPDRPHPRHFNMDG